VGLSPIPPVVGWSCAAVLLLLAGRSAARLVADRAAIDPNLPACGRTSRTGDAVHLAMAAGMVAMVVPLDVPAFVLAAFFAVTTAAGVGTWLLRVYRRRVALRRGTVPACRPAHAMEPHHLIVGLAMAAMAAMSAGVRQDAAKPGMVGMADMTGISMSSAWLGVNALALVYVWAAVLVLGARLAKTASAQPAPTGTAAVLSAPVTIYACELAMTVVMGLMLLG
jgi:Domain of unknown function (DUF5134)